METNKKSPKLAEYKHSCINCDYYTNKISDFNKHLATDKHARLTETNKKSPEIAKSRCDDFTCECGNKYKHMSSLCKHKKMCKSDNNKPVTENTISSNEIIDIIKTLIKDNQQFTKELITSVVSNQSDTIKEITKFGINNNNTTTNIVNTNSNNKTFNLQVFLNETCKNAMNITDFVDSIKLQLSDLIKMGEVGYVEGISNIITSNLQALDVTERPIHCTDKKRETVYIKDENKWQKDDDNRKLRELVKTVAYKNEKLLPQYKQKYPGCNYSESKYSDQYSKIVIESMDDNNRDKQDKIIKNI